MIVGCESGYNHPHGINHPRQLRFMYCFYRLPVIQPDLNVETSQRAVFVNPLEFTELGDHIILPSATSTSTADYKHHTYFPSLHSNFEANLVLV